MRMHIEIDDALIAWANLSLSRARSPSPNRFFEYSSSAFFLRSSALLVGTGGGGMDEDGAEDSKSCCALDACAASIPASPVQYDMCTEE